MSGVSEESTKVLKEISHKLDQLIILWKLGNRDTIESFKREIKRDKVSSKILDYANGTLTYSGLTKKVANEMKVAEITVMKKISKLREMGFLIGRKEGREVYYENSGLFE